MLRRQLRGLAIAAETVLRLAADAAGVAVEWLAPRFTDRGPAESWADTPLPDGRPKGKPYTIADVEAMRSAGPAAWRERRGSLQHAPGCAYAACVPWCPVAERVEDLREAGYTSPGSDEIRDDEATRSLIPEGEPVDMSEVRLGDRHPPWRFATPFTDSIQGIRASAGGCSALSPISHPGERSYVCEREAMHIGDHQASGVDEDDPTTGWVQSWANYDELKR